MFIDINGIVKRELDSIRAIIYKIELSNQTGNEWSVEGFKDGIEGDMVSLDKRCVSGGAVNQPQFSRSVNCNISLE